MYDKVLIILSNGECQGLMIQAMVLGRGFESWLHLKTRWKKMSHLMAENITKLIKTAKWGKSQKNIWACFEVC
jgi:hypothetical protein